MWELSESFNFKKDLENIKKNPTELKNTITEIKNKLKGISSRLDTEKEQAIPSNWKEGNNKDQSRKK